MIFLSQLRPCLLRRGSYVGRAGTHGGRQAGHRGDNESLIARCLRALTYSTSYGPTSGTIPHTHELPCLPSSYERSKDYATLDRSDSFCLIVTCDVTLYQIALMSYFLTTFSNTVNIICIHAHRPEMRGNQTDIQMGCDLVMRRRASARRATPSDTNTLTKLKVDNSQKLPVYRTDIRWKAVARFEAVILSTSKSADTGIRDTTRCAP